MALTESLLLPKYLTRNEVDDNKWNRCIDTASNKLIYGYSFYLDHMSPGWNAIVLGDYEMVMPITWRRKWGIRYLYQPAFTQQLGLFFAGKPDPQVLFNVLEFCKKHFRFAEIALNHLNSVTGGVLKNNFVLHLHASYNVIRNNYKNDLINNLKVAGKQKLSYSPGDVSHILKTFREEYGARLPQISDNDYQAFLRLCETAPEHVTIMCRKVGDAENNLLSGAILLKTKERMILAACVTTAIGKRKSATHFLLDHLIQDFAGTDVLFDFEGSDIPGIASFYKTFAPANQPYYFLHYNKLPFPLNLLKR
jgi:hypothetical protein